MRVITCDKTYSESVNFVDTNGVFVGYDLAQDCCEYADWFIHEDSGLDEYPEEGLFKPEYIDGYVFDPAYCEERSLNDGDEGGIAEFKLMRGNQTRYLYLFNSHNGYYGHGFKMTVGNEKVAEGVL